MRAAVLHESRLSLSGIIILFRLAFFQIVYERFFYYSYYSFIKPTSPVTNKLRKKSPKPKLRRSKIFIPNSLKNSILPIVGRPATYNRFLGSEMANLWLIVCRHSNLPIPLSLYVHANMLYPLSLFLLTHQICLRLLCALRSRLLIYIVR